MSCPSLPDAADIAAVLAASDARVAADDPNVNRPVAAKLWRLHDRRAYFTRTEIEAALAIPSPRSQWQCPGQFGPDGRWQMHCECAA